LLQALDFQASHPINDKSSWQRLDSRPPTNALRCWNCGRMGNHVSVACPNARKDPKTVSVAAVKVSTSSPSVPSSSSPLSRTSIVEVDSTDESGKGSDEEN
jgi:phage baseplate assembly protein gpV